MMKYRRRVDSNHHEIKLMFRQAAAVADTSMCGYGVLDLQVQYMGKTYFVEIKSKNGHVTDKQAKFIRNCPEAVIVRCKEDVIMFFQDFQQLRNKTLKEIEKYEQKNRNL